MTFERSIILDEFDQEWGAGKQPVLAEYLARVVASGRRASPDLAMQELAWALIQQDLYWRIQAGEPRGLVDRLNLPGFELSADQKDKLARLEEEWRQATHPPDSSTTLSGPSGPGIKEIEIPGYQILEVLGKGGMGVVYKAHQGPPLNRVVALKMILSGAHAGQKELARFRAEAEAVAKLQHPNIVQIYAVGEHQGLAYCALEFIPGGTLAGKIDGTPRPVKEAAETVEVLARAMHAVHQRGIVHRDLKPANVLLATDDTLKITDFGLAKRLEDGAGLTETEAILGTPSYMAPEQAWGKTREITAQTDVYALGAILYEMITGRPPFRAESPVETVLQVRNDEPVRPSLLNPKAPRDLQTICLKCLHKEPANRYASAAELAEDLRRFLHGEPIHARPVTAWERGWKWVKRHPAPASLYGLLILVAVLGSTGIVLLHRQARRLNEIMRDNYDSVRYMSELDKARQRIDSSFKLALNDQPGAAPRDYDLHWQSLQDNLEKEQANVTVAGEQELVDQLTVLSAEYRRQGDAFWRLDNPDARRKAYFGAEAGPPRLSQLANQIKTTAAAIVKLNDDEMEEAHAEAKRTEANSVASLAIGLALALLLICVFALRSLRAMFRPIPAVTQAAGAASERPGAPPR